MTCFCPSAIGLIAEIKGEMDTIHLSDKLILRNPYPEEIRRLEHMGTMKSLHADCCLLEVNEGIPADKFFGYRDTDPPTLYFSSGHPAISKIPDGRLISSSYANAVIARALTLFRLYSSGKISIRQKWMTTAHDSVLHGSPQEITYSHQLGDNSSYGQMYTLPKDISELKSLISRLWSQKIEEIGVVRWFNKSFAEIYLEDRLTDLVFALEQIYLKDEGEKSYLSYKFALRGAFLLAESRKERHDIFKTLRDGYRKRSAIVHSGKEIRGEKERELVTLLEKYLRISILKYLENPKKFKTKFWDELILYSGFPENE